MKAFACGDIVPECQARWVCSTEDEILVAVTSHARTVHHIGAIPDGMVAEVRDHIVTSA